MSAASSSGFGHPSEDLGFLTALQIKRQTGVTYESALFMMHRIRWAMAPFNAQPGGKLGGVVEAGEVFLGGKPQYRQGCVPPFFRRETMKNMGHHRKEPAFDALERGGRVALTVRGAEGKRLTYRQPVGSRGPN